MHAWERSVAWAREDGERPWKALEEDGVEANPGRLNRRRDDDDPAHCCIRLVKLASELGFGRTVRAVVRWFDQGS